MEQKDYKKIAEIIKIHKQVYGGEHNNLSRSLADYFDKEGLKEGYRMADLTGYGTKVTLNLFNRKQFLKDCGVN